VANVKACHCHEGLIHLKPNMDSFIRQSTYTQGALYTAAM